MLGLRVLNQIQLIEVVFIDNTENSPYMNSPQISTRLRDCPPEQVGCSLLWAKRAAKRAAKPCSRDGRCWPGTLGRGGGWPRCLGPHSDCSHTWWRLYGVWCALYTRWVSCRPLLGSLGTTRPHLNP